MTNENHETNSLLFITSAILRRYNSTVRSKQSTSPPNGMCLGTGVIEQGWKSEESRATKAQNKNKEMCRRSKGQT